MAKRDLTVGIDGDPKGFDSACRSAEESAKFFEAELGKLERQQTLLDQRTRRTAETVKKFSSEQSRAALSARKMGLAAEQAAGQAERAQNEAADAAEKLANGEGDAARAAELAARADHAVETAAIKAAEAHRAAAHAADQQAQQERQLARDATLAAAAERLAALRSSGAVKEHNALLGRLEGTFGDLSKEGAGAFKAIESSGSSSLTSIAELAPLGPGLLLAILVALPPAALLVGAALTLGLGGALAGLGLYATKGDRDVKAALHGMVSDIGSQTKKIAAPFKATWLEIAKTGQDTFGQIAPELQRDFALLAPVLSNFVRWLGAGLVALNPMFASVSASAGALLNAIGPHLPQLMGDLGRAISLIVNEVASHPQLFVGFLNALVQLIGVGAGVIDILIKIAEAFGVVVDASNKVNGFIARLLGIKPASDQAGQGMFGAALASGALGGALGKSSDTTTGLVQRTQHLLTAQQAAKMSTDQLKSALDKLTGANQSAFDSETQYRQALVAAEQQGRKNSAGIHGNSQAVLDNRAALSQLSAAIKSNIEDGRLNSQQIATMRSRFIASAEAMGVSRKEAVALADKLLGVRNAANKIPSRKQIDVMARTALAHNQIMEFIQWASRQHIDIGMQTGMSGRAAGGYVDGYAGGGSVRRFPTGGPVRGPGTTTSDSINSRLSNREYVVNAADTARNRPYLDAINYGHVAMASMLNPAPVAVSARGGDGASITVIPPDVHVSIDGHEVFTVVQKEGRDYSTRNHGRGPFATSGTAG